MGDVLAWVVCWRWRRANVGGVLARMTCECVLHRRRSSVTYQREWCGLCASVGKVGGVLTWVAY